MTYIKPHRLIAAIALCFVGLATAQDAPQRLPTTRLTAGFHVITAEVARTSEQRAIGLGAEVEVAVLPGRPVPPGSDDHP